MPLVKNASTFSLYVIGVKLQIVLRDRERERDKEEIWERANDRDLVSIEHIQSKEMKEGTLADNEYWSIQ